MHTHVLQRSELVQVWPSPYSTAPFWHDKQRGQHSPSKTTGLEHATRGQPILRHLACRLWIQVTRVHRTESILYRSRIDSPKKIQLSEYQSTVPGKNIQDMDHFVSRMSLRYRKTFPHIRILKENVGNSTVAKVACRDEQEKSKI